MNEKDGSEWTFQFLCSPLNGNSSSADDDNGGSNNNNKNNNNNNNNKNNNLDIGRLAAEDPRFKMLPTLNVSKYVVNGSGCFGQGSGRLEVSLDESQLTVDLLRLTKLGGEVEEKIFR